MHSLIEAKADEALADGAARLLVLWQQERTRSMQPVGVLAFDGEHYEFDYLPDVAGVDGFRPLLGFRAFDEHYVSDELFPLFRQRVFEPRRPDFERAMEQLSLDVKSATPWEQLVRTRGRSESDTVQVTPLPFATDDGWECPFLVAGLRHLTSPSKRIVTSRGEWTPYSESALEATLAQIVVGETLEIERELGNDWNSDAQVLFTSAGDIVGYLPDWLAHLTSPRLGEVALSVEVEEVAPARVGWHLRLLARIRAIEPHGDELLDRVRSYKKR